MSAPSLTVRNVYRPNEAYNAAVSKVPMPERIRALPISPAGFPVPWFVAWIDGVPDFRIIDKPKLAIAHNKKRCWVCGQPLGRNFALTLGPMCIVNRTISEPPSHVDCAVFSAQACPFLANPRMRRNEVDLPPDHQEGAGVGLKRNPGAVAVWITRGYKPFKAPDGGVLFTFDDPEQIYWFAEGEPASRDQVLASITSGLPTLEQLAFEEGRGAPEVLRQMIADAMQYLPAE